MKKLIRKLFRKEKKDWPHCNRKYLFPEWPNRDVSRCGEVNWNYIPLRKG